jgi:hypothetical protein
MARREAEDGDGFRHVGLKPAGEAGGRPLITSDCVFETKVSLGGIGDNLGRVTGRSVYDGAGRVQDVTDPRGIVASRRASR